MLHTEAHCMQTTHIEPVNTGAPVPSETPSRFERFSALVVLTIFGVTWPVLDLLGQNAEFFLARRSAKPEIVVLAVVALLLAPVLIGSMGILPGRIGKWLGGALLVLTSASLARLYLARLPLPAWLEVALAALGGSLLVWSFFRFGPVRQTARYLLPAPMLLLAIFLLARPVSDVLSEPDTGVGNPVSVANPTPILMVVFDEFPVASLIDATGNLREDRYPSFARLAADGIWFSNAVSIQQQTEHSVPAMLTGSVPEQALVPVTGHYPFNLFTALRSVYDLHVYEAITQLCPRALCEGLTRSVSSLTRDVGVVAGHVLLPRPLTDGLPAIDRGWGDFQVVSGEFDSKEEFRELLRVGQREPIDAILEDIGDPEPGSGPPLYYLHTIIPHHPWQYLPDGRSYPFIVEANPASVDGGWNDDEFLVAQSMQRHLLQVGYADHVLGEIISTLEESALYDEALVIVVADHGISIKPGVEHQRLITEDTIGEIAAVPLFVKPPGWSGGVIDERRALTIDILPTIADVIEAELPRDVEGVSLLGPAPDRESTTTYGPSGSVTYDTDGDEKLEVAQRIEWLFPGGDPWALRPEGSPDLVGQTIDQDSLATSQIQGRLKERHLYEDVDTSGAVIPARIGATLEGEVNGDEVVAVAVNGVIGAITRSYVVDDEVALLAMVEPIFFKDGANRIDLIEVGRDGLLHINRVG
jgi:hypothetical protein